MLYKNDLVAAGTSDFRCDSIDYEETLKQRQKDGISPPCILVSACLAGECCRYDGKNNLKPSLKALVDKGLALPVCPERSGGLPCPRTPCERVGDQILGRDGADYTAPFYAGAKKCLEAVDVFPIRAAVLKERSPSCGVYTIYDGSFSGNRIPGRGVFAALLASRGIPLYTEDTCDEIMTALERTT